MAGKEVKISLTCRQTWQCPGRRRGYPLAVVMGKGNTID